MNKGANHIIGCDDKITTGKNSLTLRNIYHNIQSQLFFSTNMNKQQDSQEFILKIMQEIENASVLLNKNDKLSNTDPRNIFNYIIDEYKVYDDPVTGTLDNVKPVVTNNSLFGVEPKGNTPLNDILNEYINTNGVLTGRIGDDNDYSSIGGNGPTMYEKIKMGPPDLDNRMKIENKTNDKGPYYVEFFKYEKIKYIGPYLIIYIKRFNYNDDTGITTKINDNIPIPLQIHIQDQNSHYQLTSCVNHIGASVDDGHYISFLNMRSTHCKYRYNGNPNNHLIFNEYDDDTIRKHIIDESNIDNIEKNLNDILYGNGTPYVLFYRKESLSYDITNIDDLPYH
jgi:hypothetical protein